MINQSSYHPNTDGIDHCNVYTKGKTLLGRMMTNLSNCHITHPRYGDFRTLEGLWYYLKTGKNEEMFRVLSGYDARNLGKDMDKIWDQEFQREFKVGIICKILASEDLRKMLIESELPFVHYYYYGKDPAKLVVVVPKGHEWQMEFWTDMRTKLKNGVDISTIIPALLNFTEEKKKETDKQP